MQSSFHRPDVRHVGMSAGQQGLWFASRLDPESAGAYDMVFAFETDGEIDIPLLERALDVLQDSHEMLRAQVEFDDGVPRLVVHPAGTVDRVRVALRTGALAAVAHAEAGRPIALDAAPLLQVAHVRPPQGSGRTGLLFRIPHLLFDGPSADRLFAELGDVARRLAAGQNAARAGDDGTLAAFVRHESTWLQGVEGRAAAEAVRHRIAGAAPRLDLPGSAASPALLRIGEARVLEFPIEADGIARVAALARSRRVTPAAVWLAAFELALWRLTGQADFLVTLPVSQHDRVEHEGALGYFTNLGVARARVVEPHTGTAFLDGVADDLLEALETRAVPFKVVASHQRGTPRGPMPSYSQLGFNYERRSTGMSFPLGTSLMRSCELAPRWAKEALKLDVLESPEGARGWLVAERATFDETALEDFAGSLFEMLEGLLEDASATLARLGGHVAA